MVKCKKRKYIVERLPITIEVEENGINAMFNISSKDNNENEAVVAEFDEYYQIETNNELSKILFLFINSKYFSSKKPFKIKTKLIKFRKRENYRNIADKIKPYFS